jgi:glyoxylase-like metal-dependent hydrolase (beta-lactamase superfamily II)
MVALSAAGAWAQEAKSPGCANLDPRACLVLALDAMGGRARLESLKSIAYTSAGHTALVEQSYRQEPFITAYERLMVKVDFAGNRVYRESRLTWPEADPGTSEVVTTFVFGPQGGVRKNASADGPCSLSDLDWARDTLSLGPARLLLTALQAPDLHYESPEVLRATSHAVLAFTTGRKQVRVLLNQFNHLPDAFETVEQFHDHWWQWGDVHRRVYLDNFQDFHGLVYPTNEVEERNGILWQSRQVLSLDQNVAIDETRFRMDPKVAEKSAQGKGWDRPFQADKSQELAPGVTLFEGAWNATLIDQGDGVLVLEAPISGTYIQGVFDEAKRRYSSLPIKAALLTSDSWPHVGGVRQAVARGVPVYILDLNQPLLDRLVKSPHKLHPDLLEQSPKAPRWQIVSEKLSVGTGKNRVELYPLRGASTERQYMVYFPDAKLLYASDTLALNDDGSLYDPELMREVAEAVKREGLLVNTVFAMHQGPMPWTNVMALVQKAGS